MRKIEKKPRIKVEKCFRQHSGRKSEITGSGLQISKKHSIPNNDKKVYLFNLQFIINNFNNSPFHSLSNPPPRCFFTPTSPVVSSPPPPPSLSPLIRCKKETIIVFLRCLQNYGVSGGGRLNKCRGVKQLVILKLF